MVAEHDVLVLRTRSDGGPCRDAIGGVDLLPRRDHWAERASVRLHSISSSRGQHTVARRAGVPIGVAQQLHLWETRGQDLVPAVQTPADSTSPHQAHLVSMGDPHTLS